MRRLSSVPIVMAVLLSSFSFAPGVLAADGYPLSPSDAVVQDARDYLASEQDGTGMIGSAAGSQWACIAVGALGEDPNDWSNGGPTLVQYIESNPGISGNVTSALARIVLAAVAAGEDPSSFGTYTDAYVTVPGDYLGALLDRYDDAEGQFDEGSGDFTTINEDMWAVRALLAAGVSPNSDEVEGAVNFLMTHKEADGGWSWGLPANAWYSPGSSPDDTGTAIVALVSAGVSPAAPEIVDGLDFLKTSQGPNGGFMSWGEENVSSSSWGSDGIGAARRNPSGSAWQTNGLSPIDFIIDQQQPDGSIPYYDGAAFPMAVENTSWAIVTLVGNHYDPAFVSSVGGLAEKPSPWGILLPWIAGAVVLSCVAVWRFRVHAVR